MKKLFQYFLYDSLGCDEFPHILLEKVFMSHLIPKNDFAVYCWLAGSSIYDFECIILF